MTDGMSDRDKLGEINGMGISCDARHIDEITRAILMIDAAVAHLPEKVAVFVYESTLEEQAARGALIYHRSQLVEAAKRIAIESARKP